MIRWKQYAVPFDHLVGQWDPESRLLDVVSREFPDPEWGGWQRFDNQDERKMSLEVWQGPATQQLADYLSDPDFVSDVANRLGIEGSLSSSFHGGGYHCIPVGGYLGMHVDFNLLSRGVYRRANVLVYLNSGWRAEHGGGLILGEAKVKTVFPEMGTVVAFPTGESSWHGHPRPVTRLRKSFAIYIYSDQPPADYTGEEHTTIFA